ncbi:hypothetical protein BV22DRAFT_1004879, partial [Leucogyrophana mollusca]
LEFAPPPKEKPLAKVRSPEQPRTKTRTFNVEHLRLHVPPLPSHITAISPSPNSPLDFASPANSTFTQIASPRPSGKISLNRFISGGSKASKADEASFSRWPSTSPTASVVTAKTSRKEEAREEKTRKAEEKKRKKAEAKAKMEQLAEELKERQRRKASTQDRQSVHSGRSNGRGGRRQWDDDRAMYDGLGAL